MSQITTADVEREVRAIVAEAPDFMYGLPSDGICLYFDRDGTPSCLVGHALSRLGFTAEQLDPHESNEVDEVLVRLGIDGESGWLSVVQSMQDDGFTWAQCVTAADAIDDSLASFDILTLSD